MSKNDNMTSPYLYATKQRGHVREDGEERRRSVRYPRVADAWIWSPTADDPVEQRLEVTAVNLSRHGVAFDLDRPIASGSFQMIEIALGEQRLVSEIRIVSCRKLDNGQFEVGAAFC